MFKFLLVLGIFSVLELRAYGMFDVIKGDTVENKFEVGVGVSYLEKELLCSSFNKEEILIDLNGKVFKYFSDTYKEYKIFLTGRSLKTYLIFDSNKIRYRVGHGIIDSMRYHISSDSEMVSTNYGSTYSIGMWMILFPSTIVSNEMLLGVDNCFVIQDLDFLTTNSIKYKINTSFRLYEFSFDLIFSKSLSKLLSLNYGFEVEYREFSIIDKYNYFKIEGSNFSSSIHLGTMLNLTSKERINFEFSFSFHKELNIYTSYLIRF